MTNTFILYDQGRFARILIFAILIHLLFLIGLDVYPHTAIAPTLKRKMATMFDITINTHANQRVPKVAINIAPRNHASLVLQGTNESKPEKAEVQLTAESPSTLVKSLSSTTSSPVHVKQTPVPRRRIISAAAHEARDAAYLARWQTYVEKYGNAHYPQAALKSNLRGNLRLLVAINRDGTLREVSLRQSSGSPVLDQAAINIVLQSAPFEALPDELAQDFEVLEIIRTWQFRGKLSTSG